MKDKLKNIGWSILGFIIIIGLIIIATLLIKGGIWLSAKIYPYLLATMRLTVVITFFILSPLTIFKKTKGIGGMGMVIASYVFGATLWIWGLLLTYTKPLPNVKTKNWVI